MSLKYFCITQQGASHIRHDLPCQDASGGMDIRIDGAGHDVVLAAVADGVGSCAFSQFGADVAVKSALKYLADNLAELNAVDDMSVAAALRAAFQFALDSIEEDALSNSRPFVEMDTTLTVAVYLDDGTLWCGHIGDGGIVALYDDATYEMITRRHKGEEFNSVYPLRNRALWSFGRARRPVAALALMTDGVLDLTVTSERYNERVYFPMLGPALARPLASADDVAACRKTMENFLASAAFRERVKDDITLVAVQNSDMVAALPEVRFGRDAWQAEQKRIRQEIDERLKAAAQCMDGREPEPETDDRAAPVKQDEPSARDGAAERSSAAQAATEGEAVGTGGAAETLAHGAAGCGPQSANDIASKDTGGSTDGKPDEASTNAAQSAQYEPVGADAQSPNDATDEQPGPDTGDA